MSNPKYGSLQVFYSHTGDDDKSIQLLTNIQGVKQFNIGPEVLGDISMVLSSYTDDDQIYFKVQAMIGATVVDESDFNLYADSYSVFAVRIFFFDQFVSVNVNDRWVYSYAFSTIVYTEDTTASIKLDGDTTTITDIRRVELSDGREAVFVDYESTTDNAVQSIIQQRPVQVNPHANRKLTFTYAAEKDTLNGVRVSEYEEAVSQSASMSSDGLVYAEDVGVSIDVETARDIGFITRLYRLSELNTGAERATRTIQRQARERGEIVNIVQRLDPRLEISDVLHVDLVLTGTERHVERDVIIEDLRIALKDGDYSMNITGRKKSGTA